MTRAAAATVVVDPVAPLARSIAELYPKVHALVGERCGNTGSGTGGDSTVTVPIRLDVLAFACEQYEDSTVEFKPGITLTVVECEQLARIDLGRDVILRSRAGWDGLSPDPRVGAALSWLAMVGPDLRRSASWAIVDHLRRLEFQALAWLRLTEPVILRDICPYCAEATFIADVDRAVCSNPRCRDDLGGRRCWRWDVVADGWEMIAEPQVNERGRLLRHRDDLDLLEHVITVSQPA